MSAQLVDVRTKRNRASLDKAQDEGRVHVRGLLPDAESSKQYQDLAEKVGKRKLGQMLAVAVRLAHAAEEQGIWELDKSGNIVMHDENPFAALQTTNEH